MIRLFFTVGYIALYYEAYWLLFWLSSTIYVVLYIYNLSISWEEILISLQMASTQYIIYS